MFFWSLASLANLNIDQLVHESGGISQDQDSYFLAALTIGVGLGSLLAGYWSGKRVELGIIPIGMVGIIIFSALLYFCNATFFSTGENPTLLRRRLLVMRFAFLHGGERRVFDIPLEAYMQENSPKESRGAVLAANNFLSFGGIIIVSGLYILLRYPFWAAAAATPTTVAADAAHEVVTKLPLFTQNRFF